MKHAEIELDKKYFIMDKNEVKEITVKWVMFEGVDKYETRICEIEPDRLFKSKADLLNSL